MKEDETGSGRDKAPKRRKLKWQIEHLYSCEIGAGLSLQIMPTTDRPCRFLWTVFRTTADHRPDRLTGAYCRDLSVATIEAEEAGKMLLVAEERRNTGSAPVGHMRSERWQWVCHLEWCATEKKESFTGFCVKQNPYRGTEFYAIQDGARVLDGTASSVSEGIERCEAFAEETRQQTRRNLLAATVREPVSDVRAA